MSPLSASNQVPSQDGQTHTSPEEPTPKRQGDEAAPEAHGAKESNCNALGVVVIAGLAVGVVAATSGGKKTPPHHGSSKPKTSVVSFREHRLSSYRPARTRWSSFPSDRP